MKAKMPARDNMDEPHKQNVEWKEGDMKDYMWYILFI